MIEARAIPGNNIDLSNPWLCEECIKITSSFVMLSGTN